MPKPTKSKLLKSFDALLAGQNNGDFASSVDDDDDVGDGTRAALAARDSDDGDDDQSEQVGSGV